MIISPGRNYIFVHIPKTGGTALATALEGRAMKDDILIGDTPKARRRRGRLKGVRTAGRLWKHSTLADIKGLVPADTLAQAFTFTLVRNPWDRMVSYYHWLRMQTFDHPAVTLARRVPFARFVEDDATQAAIRAAPYGSYMQTAHDGERCDLFIRLEAFGRDAVPLWDHLGFRLDLAVVNASDRAPGHRDHYTRALAKRIESLCAEDIARFGYQF